jgi:hypothetical protein
VTGSAPEHGSGAWGGGAAVRSSAGFPPAGGGADVGPGIRDWLWGEHPGTWGRRGAPWIAQQIGEVFPRHRYLLDPYHLLEHLYSGATGLPENGAEEAGIWVAQQMALIDQGKIS